MYLYENHMGGLYWSERLLSYDERYCDTCGDTDWEIGYFESAVEVLKYMADDIDANESGGYDLNYILDIIVIFEDCPSLEEAERIVIENKTESCGEE